METKTGIISGARGKVRLVVWLLFITFLSEVIAWTYLGGENLSGPAVVGYAGAIIFRNLKWPLLLALVIAAINKMVFKNYLKIVEVVGALMLMATIFTGMDFYNWNRYVNADRKTVPAGNLDDLPDLDSVKVVVSQGPLGLTWGMSQKETLSLCKYDSEPNKYMQREGNDESWQVTQTPVMPEGTRVVSLYFYKDQLWNIAVFGKKLPIELTEGLAERQLKAMERTLSEKYVSIKDKSGRIKFRDATDSMRGDTTLFVDEEGGVRYGYWMIRYVYMPIARLKSTAEEVENQKKKEETSRAL